MTTTQALATQDRASAVELALIQGDLSEMEPEARIAHYMRVCESLDLNPWTKPFAYLLLDGRTELYARKDCTEQLRTKRGVSVTRLESRKEEGLYIVTAYGVDARGRTDSAIGAVPIAKENGTWKTSGGNPPKRYFEGNGTFSEIRGEALANAIMKAETKAKRRLTLSLCGLGMTDESELEGIPGARVIDVDLPQQRATTVITETTESAAAAPAQMVTSADHRVWQRWIEVKGEAEGLGVRVSELRLPLPLAELKEHGQRVLEAIEARKQQLAEQEAAAAAAKAARDAQPEDLPSFGDDTDPLQPDTTQFGNASTEPQEESKPSRADLWQENRRLVARATELGLAGVPTLGNRSGEDVIATANAELRHRIDNAELDQHAARAGGQLI